MMTALTKKENNKKIIMSVLSIALMVGICMLCITNPAFADYEEAIKSRITTLTGIIKTIFQAVGVVLCIYSVGQLILAFKNEDADAKARASTQLVVGVALTAMPAILEALHFEELWG